MTSKTKKRIKERPDFAKETQIDPEIPAEEKTEAKITLADMTQELLKIRKVLFEEKEFFLQKTKPITEIKERLERTILETMQKEGDFSRRFQFATLSRGVRKSLKVIDEKEVIGWLEKNKLDKEYASVQLNDLFYDSFAKSVIKEGAPIAGTSIEEREYLSISTVKKEGVERRKIAPDWPTRS